MYFLYFHFFVLKKNYSFEFYFKMLAISCIEITLKCVFRTFIWWVFKQFVQKLFCDFFEWTTVRVQKAYLIRHCIIVCIDRAVHKL